MPKSIVDSLVQQANADDAAFKESKAAPVAQPAKPAEKPAEIYGYEITDEQMADPSVYRIPDPPTYILDKLKRSELAWRWLSYPNVKVQGMRNYTAYSPTAEERKLIDAGKAPAGVHVDEKNHVCFWQDAFLGTIPRRLYEQKLKRRDQIRKDRTQVANEQPQFREAVNRLGAKGKSVYKEWKTGDADLDSED